MSYVDNSHTLFGKIQAAVGTPAVLADADAVAALNLEHNIETETEEFQFSGLESRAVETDITDQLRTVGWESFFPSAGGTAGTGNKLWEFFEAAGASNVVTATVSAESTNAVKSTDVLTLEYYKHSEGGDHKKVVLADSVGAIDLTIEIGKRAMFKSAFRGNYSQSIQEAAGRVADWGAQKANLAMRITKDTLTTVMLQPLGEAAVPNFNICFGKLEVSNFFGFDLTRYKHSCAEGHALKPVPGEVKLTILEQDAGYAPYEPEDHWNDHHSLLIEWGGGAGSMQSVALSDIQLTSISDTSLGPWRGQELTFKNNGTSSAKTF